MERAWQVALKNCQMQENLPSHSLFQHHMFNNQVVSLKMPMLHFLLIDIVSGKCVSRCGTFH